MKMNAKKITAIVLALLILCGGIAAYIHSNNSHISVYVSISSSGGKLDLADECIKVNDEDGDGKITVNDVLDCAHDKKYPGGSATGYAVYNSPDFEGVSLLRLWGVSCDGCFGYYVNDAQALSLADEIAENDHVYAFVYTDTQNYTDAYSFFSQREISAKQGEEFTLTLTKAVFDSSWNINKTAVKGATITLDGEETQYVTDENGNVTLAVSQVGAHLISAVSPSGEIITPPVCKVEVK